MTIKRYGVGVLVTSSSKAYPEDWPVICRLWALFGGKRLGPYKFFFNVSLTDLEKSL